MSLKPAITLTREELYERMWATPRPLVASELGLSSNGLAKICDRMLIPYPPWGYWAKQRACKALDVEPLGPPPEGAPETISFESNSGTRSRRPRSRLTRAARTLQILDLASQMIVRDGWSKLTLRDLAKYAGISETLVYGYWSDRAALGAALARRELKIVADRYREDNQQEIASYLARGCRTLLTSLKLAAERGGVLQMLLADPAVRQLVRRDYREIRGDMQETYARDASEAFKIPLALAKAHAQLNFAVAVRVGKYIATGHITQEEGLRLSTASNVATMEARRRGYRQVSRAE